MKKRMYKVVSIILAIEILFLLMPQIVFAETSSDYTYTVTEGNAVITSYSGSGGNVTIPSTLGGYPVIEIDSYAFYGKIILTGVTIPYNVKHIGFYSFSGCNKLTTLTLGSGLVSIDDNAFEYCSSLKTIIIPNSVTTIGWATFSNCNSITSIVIGNSVEIIGGSTFYKCSSVIRFIIQFIVTTEVRMYLLLVYLL